MGHSEVLEWLMLIVSAIGVLIEALKLRSEKGGKRDEDKAQDEDNQDS